MDICTSATIRKTLIHTKTRVNVRNVRLSKEARHKECRLYDLIHLTLWKDKPEVLEKVVGCTGKEHKGTPF